jgi:sugar lactone lactonase YvrE
VERLLDAELVLGEGCRWDAVGGRLLFVDIERGELHAYDGTTHDVVQLGTRVGAVAPTAGGDVLLALQDRLALLAGGTLVPFPWAADIRANDGACDPQGRFWIGSMALDQRPGAAALYRFDGVHLERQLEDLTISNGLGWIDDRMYFIDTPTGRVDLFDYDGDISRRRPFAHVDRGKPDGMCLDDDGFVWVACHGGGCVQRYAPDGSLDRTLEVPEPNVTCCCFWEGLLVVTTRAHIWVADVGVSGPPAEPFRA